jgi:hypothetical protein
VRGNGYTLQYAEATSPNPIRWPSSSLYVSISNSLNEPQPNIKKGSDVIGALRRSLKRWSSVARFDFLELSSTNQNVSPVSSGDGINLITVAPTRENSSLFRGVNAGQPARTRVYFNASGNIVEADIALNPFQKFSTDGTFGTYDLEATFTHEIGHMIGLDHSTVLGAALQPRQAWNGTFYSPQISGRSLSSDDRAGARALYGNRSNVPSGSVGGTVTFPGGAPVAGVNVWAEDASDGRVAESSITRLNGSYRLGNLAPGAYKLYAASLDGPIGLGDLESSRAAYAATDGRTAALRTREIGRVEVQSGSTRAVNIEISTEPSDFVLSVVGINNQASSVAVPLVAGNTYTVFAGGRGVLKDDLLLDSIGVSSPFLHVDRTTIEQEGFGDGIDVISFHVTIDPKAPTGIYSLWTGSKNGALACLVGALVVSDNRIDERLSHILPTDEDADGPVLDPFANIRIDNSSGGEVDPPSAESNLTTNNLVVLTLS